MSNITIKGRAKSKINLKSNYESNLPIHKKVKRVIDERSKTSFHSYVELVSNDEIKKPKFVAIKKPLYGLEEQENEKKFVVKSSQVLLDEM